MHLLAFRFSAMGDVALTVPVIRAVLDQNPGLQITLVTPSFFAPFFNEIPRLNLVHPDFKVRHKGFKGLYLLYKELCSKSEFDGIADLHNVLRTRILSLFFGLNRVKVSRINKGRIQKRDFIKGVNKLPLKKSWERYADVFAKFGLQFDCVNKTGIIPQELALVKVNDLLLTLNSDDKILIGIAPFAMHKLKMWGLDSVKELILKLQSQDVQIFLFGGGKHEVEELDNLAVGLANVYNMAGKIPFDQEIALMSKMSFVISMDSSNMHISALVGTPTFSLWMGTHPDVGFSAYNQPLNYAIQVPSCELKCRPCTVFGKGECRLSEQKCKILLTSDFVYKKIKLECQSMDVNI